MVSATLLHHPQCSKSRQALALLEAEPQLALHLRLYQQQPLSAEELSTLLAQLIDPPSALVRTGDAAFQALGRSAEDLSHQEIISLLSEHPQLMQRPVLIIENQAKIGRPPEDLLSLLPTATQG
ncbi:ArsC/Spx/MgsR family protein [Marinospirillum sp. MEB164]|uniref:ArsC/Spx/MgsR family protein n=1 Tax=Marinospirillum alkalitolerans TaxID=3123374 RepID=A0ABW8PXA0_9GAMM